MESWQQCAVDFKRVNARRTTAALPSALAGTLNRKPSGGTAAKAGPATAIEKAASARVSPSPTPAATSCSGGATIQNTVVRATPS